MMSTFDSIYALIEDSSPLEVAVASAAELLVKQRIYDWFFFLFFSFFFLPFYFFLLIFFLFIFLHHL